MDRRSAFGPHFVHLLFEHRKVLRVLYLLIVGHVFVLISYSEHSRLVSVGFTFDFALSLEVCEQLPLLGELLRVHKFLKRLLLALLFHFIFTDDQSLVGRLCPRHERTWTSTQSPSFNIRSCVDNLVYVMIRRQFVFDFTLLRFDVIQILRIASIELVLHFFEINILNYF